MIEVCNEDTATRTETVLRCQSVTRVFGENIVLNDCSISLPKGMLCGLIGPSGGGKSVLLKILAGVDQGFSGSVTRPQDMEESDISFMFQEGALFDSLSVFDNIAFPLVHGDVPVNRLAMKTRDWVSAKVSNILGSVGLLEAASKYPGQLSGGMRRRVSLARALISEPRILLLDDPTAGLDPVASSVIMQLIVDSQKRTGCTALVVSQDLRRLLPICTLLFALYQGKIRFSGNVSELATRSESFLKTFVSARYDLELEAESTTI